MRQANTNANHLIVKQNVEFYATFDKDPKYVKESEPFIQEFGCNHIGDIKVEHGRQDKFKNNEILVKVVFGLTQLSVRVEYTIAGEKKQVRAQFEMLKQHIFLSIVETLKLSKLMSLTFLCHLGIIVRDSENEYHYFMLKLVTVETTVKKN